MFSSEAIWGFFFISQISVGLMGNSLVFVLNIYTFFTQSCLKKPIDGIFIHLTFINILSITCKLIPDLVSTFGDGHFLDDVGCKATLSTHRVTRGVSICTTALLSVFQAITISPGNSKWAWIKSKLSTCIYLSFLFFWIINTLIYIHIIRTVVARRNFTSFSSGYSTLYCQTKPLETDDSLAFLSVMVMRDLLFVVLKLWSSLYMVTFLYKHRRRAQHLHSPHLFSQPSPEIKATHTILLLVGCFVSFFCINNLVTLYFLYVPKKSLRMQNISGMISCCYPTLCPFVLMKNKISKWTSSLSQMKIAFCQRTLSR